MVLERSVFLTDKNRIPHIRINLLPPPTKVKTSVNWRMSLLCLFRAFREFVTGEQKTEMRIKNVETLLLEYGSYQKWLRSVDENYIVRYLSKKDIARCHPMLINAISMYPFRRKKHILFVCKKFQELLLYAEDYYQTDILAAAAGFLEAAGFTPALQQLIWRRNYFLTQGFSESDDVIIILNSVIQSLIKKEV